MEEFFRTATDNLKNKIMNEFKDVKTEKDKHAESIVRNHVIFSMGAGMIPVIVVDILAVSASQLDMIRQLCKVYDQEFSENQGKAIVSSLTTSTLARMGAGSLAKMIPIVGSIVGAVTNSVLAGASTYALGQVFKMHFQTGGTILDFDSKRLKKLYDEQFEKGKKIAEELRQQRDAKRKAETEATAAASETAPPPSAAAADQFVPDPGVSAEQITRLKELAELKTGGIITEEEFERMKKKIIGD
ncbi:MAG: DUF697 domain-containing protein [Bacteroidota bacterium]